MTVSKVTENAQKAKKCFEEALDSLDSASHWGILDILGGEGGGFSTFVKHCKINRAQDLISEGKKYILLLQEGLEYTDSPDIDIGLFLTYLDFFHDDGRLPGIIVQSRISDARQKLHNAIKELDGILKNIKQY